MLWKDIIKSVDNVVLLLNSTKLMEHVLRPKLMNEMTTNPLEIISAFSAVSQISQKFGDTEKKIMKDLDLDFLLSQEFWAKMVSDTERSPDARNAASHAYSSMSFALEHLPKLIKVLERENDAVLETISEDSKKASNIGSITVIVIEDNQVSTPNRLVLMLEAIEGLYDASSHIAGLEGNDLSVISCDSGSDKSFDFLGAAQIMTIVKEIIIDFWNKLVYFREDKSERHLELIANSLPILERIADMREKKKIEPERAELLKRQVIESVGKFAKAGVTIPEIEAFTVFNPRQLMKPEPKLLLPPREIIDVEKSKDKKDEPQSKKKKINKKDGNFDLDDPKFKEFLSQKVKEYQEGQDTNEEESE